MNEIQSPSVGRKVWYFESADWSIQPWDATIIKVHGMESCQQPTPFTRVNLLATDPDSGEQFFVEGVSCSPVRVDYPHFDWMPYQKGQAAKQAASDLLKEVDYRTGHLLTQVANPCKPAPGY